MQRAPGKSYVVYDSTGKVAGTWEGSADQEYVPAQGFSVVEVQAINWGNISSSVPVVNQSNGEPTASTKS